MFKNKEEFKQEFAHEVESVFGRPVEDSHLTEKYLTLGYMIRNYVSLNWKDSKYIVSDNQEKTMYYFSMEFLMGRLLTNNLMNLGIYDIVKEGLADLGVDINELENVESDAGLGNGGLGRLAACFLDSLASQGYAGHGICIRYQYGLFKQLIDDDGNQIEVPDQWLKVGNVWEVRKPKHSFDVKFWGRVEMGEMTPDGKMTFNHVDYEAVRAVAYDVPIVGANTRQTNTLRLWSAEPSEDLPKNKDFRQYLEEISEICLNVYPDDSTEDGRILRLKQQYFFVSAGLQAIVKQHLRNYGTMDNFADKVAIQLNDTHPALAIPELMRILMDEHQYEWEDAWRIVVNTMAYTNHTVLAEALEKWPVSYVKRLLPRIYMIIEEINRRWCQEVREKFPDKYYLLQRVSIIKEDQVYMASLSVVGSHSINGVAKIHSDIIKNDVFKDFVRMYPERFNNKTNGITHRRWLLYSNPQLTKLLDETIGTAYHKDFDKIIDLMEHVDDEKLQTRFLQVKRERKVILADYIKKTCGVDINPDSIFDVQAKRLHAYKRQLLNVFHIIYLYQRLKSDPNFKIYPRTFIFAAKAAPAYTFAKQVIKLINRIGMIVNNDPSINQMLKVVFIPNYNVSIAEILMNAADVSEQISTAGKEASGTGNMKFMMNGAITLGTLDGANVEIDQLVGRGNDVIFGLTVEQIKEIKTYYNYNNYLNNDARLRDIYESLRNGPWVKDINDYRKIYEDLSFNNDEYMLFADFDSYESAQREIERRYLDRAGWARSCLINIAKSGYFSSDRTIREYCDEIWHIKPTGLQ